MTPDICPLCGTSVALLRQPERRSRDERLRLRIATLRDRAARLERGSLTPRALKEEALWLCAACQPLLAGAGRLGGQEIQRRIHDEIRQLERERERNAHETRAS